MAKKTSSTNSQTALIRRAVILNPDVTVTEICELIAAQDGDADVMLSTIYATRASTKETLRVLAEIEAEKKAAR
jgi:hypothetical protein